MAETKLQETARAARESHWDKERLAPVIESGSEEESRILARIDELRDEELAGQMRGHPDFTGPAYRSARAGADISARRARARAHWRRYATR